MKSVLHKATLGDVATEPFPHLVVRDALEDEVYHELSDTFPPFEVIAGDADPGSNKRFDLMGKDILTDDRVAPVWKHFSATHTSREFLGNFLDLFESHVLRIYPGIEERLGPLRDLRPGLRLVDTFESSDVMLDATVVVNTPVVETPTSVRGVHVDKLHKLYTGLFYMRHPEDPATGGDLELYSYRKGTPEGFGSHGRDTGQRVADLAPERVEHVATVPYEANLFVIFPVSIFALHGVTVRSRTLHSRRLCTIIADLEHDQYALPA